MYQNHIKMAKSTILNLIQEYASHRILWDTRHKDFYNKPKRRALWDQLAQSFGVPKKALMAKMRTLSGTYRQERHRERKSKDTKNPYKSKWFAFEAFSYLRSRDHIMPKDLPDLQGKCSVVVQRIEYNEDPEDGDIWDDDDDSEQSQQETEAHCKQSAAVTDALKRNPNESLDAEVENDLTSNFKNEAPNFNAEDSNTAFGLYIASELRKYDSVTLVHVKHAINKIIFQADTDFFQGNHYDINRTNENNDIQMQQIKSEIDIDNDSDNDNVPLNQIKK